MRSYCRALLRISAFCCISMRFGSFSCCVHTYMFCSPYARSRNVVLSRRRRPAKRAKLSVVAAAALGGGQAGSSRSVSSSSEGSSQRLPGFPKSQWRTHPSNFFRKMKHGTMHMPQVLPLKGNSHRTSSAASKSTAIFKLFTRDSQVPASWCKCHVEQTQIRWCIDRCWERTTGQTHSSTFVSEPCSTACCRPVYVKIDAERQFTFSFKY